VHRPHHPKPFGRFDLLHSLRQDNKIIAFELTRCLQERPDLAGSGLFDSKIGADLDEGCDLPTFLYDKVHFLLLGVLPVKDRGLPLQLELPERDGNEVLVHLPPIPGEAEGLCGNKAGIRTVDLLVGRDLILHPE